MENYLVLSQKSKAKILDYLPNEFDIQRLATFFQNFCDSTRLKIITCLSMSDMCVNDISTLLNINQTTISHQLKLLKSQNFVSYKRSGKILLYSLNEKRVNDIMYIAMEK